ncbi:hypothetical protein [Novosphingobium panipatense]|uniref:hypothetical protein n=1 Tax=Novosphingobium panipatense TaxID=428991 RepID=UPI0036218CB0
MTPSAERVATEVELWLDEPRNGPLVVGVCGAQGSGKSTLAAALKAHFEAGHRRVAILSLDDLYLTRQERTQLARQVHPLFATRGVPGTHDVALGIDLIDRMRAEEAVTLPGSTRPGTIAPPWAVRFRQDATCCCSRGCVGARPQSLPNSLRP